MHEHERTVDFHDTTLTLSQSMRAMAESIHAHGERTSVRDLLAVAGEHGLLLAIMLLTVPFLLPVSIPGSSTILGTVGILLSVAVILNRLPWMPERFLDLSVESARLAPAIEKGADIVHRVDRVTHPRLERLTDGAVMNRMNGFGLVLANVLLLFPLGFVPFSNLLPGWAVLTLAAGMSQRDGVLILAGYGLILASIVYFTVLAVAALATGQGLMDLLRS